MKSNRYRVLNFNVGIIANIFHRYTEAIQDGRSSLKYKLDLYSKESEIVAEAHFKLSLALEFASITTTSEDAAENGPKQLDQGLRDEAAAELEKAIESTQLKLENKEVELAMMHVPEDNEVTRSQIAEVKDLIADMEQRVSTICSSPPRSPFLSAARAFYSFGPTYPSIHPRIMMNPK